MDQPLQFYMSTDNVGYLDL